MENCKIFNPFRDFLRFRYETGKKQSRIFAGFAAFSWILPGLPRYCAESTTMCNNIFGNTEMSYTINHKLVKNTPNVVQIGHELTEIRDDSRDFLAR